MKSNTMKNDQNDQNDQSQAIDECFNRCKSSLSFLSEVRFSYWEVLKADNLDGPEKELFEEILSLANEAHELLSLSINRGKQFRPSSRRSMIRFIVSATEQNCVPDATDLKRMRKHCFTSHDFKMQKKALNKSVAKVVG